MNSRLACSIEHRRNRAGKKNPKTHTLLSQAHNLFVDQQTALPNGQKRGVPRRPAEPSRPQPKPRPGVCTAAQGAAWGQAWRPRGPPEGPGSLQSSAADRTLTHLARRAARTADSRLSGACPAVSRRPRRPSLARRGHSAPTFAGLLAPSMVRSLAAEPSASAWGGEAKLRGGGAAAPTRPPLGSQPTPAR